MWMDGFFVASCFLLSTCIPHDSPLAGLAANDRGARDALVLIVKQESLSEPANRRGAATNLVNVVHYSMSGNSQKCPSPAFRKFRDLDAPSPRNRLGESRSWQGAYASSKRRSSASNPDLRSFSPDPQSRRGSRVRGFTLLQTPSPSTTTAPLS